MYHTLEEYAESSKKFIPLHAPNGLSLNFGYMGRGMLLLRRKKPEELCDLFQSVPDSVTDVDMRGFNFYSNIMETLNAQHVSLPQITTLLVTDHDLNTVHRTHPQKLEALRAVFPNARNIIFHDRKYGKPNCYYTPGEPLRLAQNLGFKVSAPSLEKLAFSSVDKAIIRDIDSQIATECESYKQNHANKDMPYQDQMALRKKLITQTIKSLKIPKSLQDDFLKEAEERYEKYDHFNF